MNRGFLIGWLFAGALFSNTAYADLVTLTLDPTILTVTEGRPITLDWTVHNNSGATIQVGALAINSLPQFISGDLTDALLLGSPPIDVGTCFSGPIASGGTCSWGTNFTTPNDTGETDVDFGVWSVSTQITLTSGLQYFSAPVSVTVADVPEPHSVSLLLTAIAAVGLVVGKRRLRRSSSAV